MQGQESAERDCSVNLFTVKYVIPGWDLRLQKAGERGDLDRSQPNYDKKNEQSISLYKTSLIYY